jgi:endonuclease-8
MPEGDTIYRAATTLHRALAGQLVVRFESVFPKLSRTNEDSPLAGQVIQQVQAIGKHLLIRFSGGQVLRTHMRMNGSWHIYRPGESWRRSRRDMRILVATRQFEAVGFNIPVAEFVREDALHKHRELRQLGPDLLSDTFDRNEALRRLTEHRQSMIADLLLNQRVIAGIGNVYKSEVLFACRVNPFVAVGHLDPAQIDCLIDTSSRFLRANATTRLSPMTTYAGYRRTTRHDDPSQRLWVYGRAGLPCRRCATPICVRKQGPDARLTYWCPMCQPGAKNHGERM